jgi:hypothetical protein
MNPWLSCALADARGREMRGEPACPRGRPTPGEAARSLVREIRPEAARSQAREIRPEAARAQAREIRPEAARAQAPEIRPEAARSRIGPPGTAARPARGARRRWRVRHRIGFALVEAGLRLLATASGN